MYDAILHPLYRARFREKWKAIIERRAAINSRKIGYTIYEQNQEPNKIYDLWPDQNFDTLFMIKTA